MHVLLADLVALVGGTVHSMVPGEPPRVATVLLRDGRIEAVAESLELPPGTSRYDLTGRHVVPGLIDAMLSFDADHDALYTSSGITTVRDAGGERVRLLLERRAESRQRVPGPRLLTAGALVDGDPPSTPEAAVVRDVAAAEALLPLLLQDGPDFVSIHQGLAAAPWRRILELAHESGVTVWGPLPKAVALADAIEAGQDGLFYLDALLPPGIDWRIVQAPAFEGSVRALADAGTAFVPLLHPYAARFQDQTRLVDLLRFLDPQYEPWWLGELEVRRQAMTPASLEVGARILEKQRALLLRLFQAGVHLVPGSAAPHPWLLPGQAFHQELAEWERAGIPAGDVLAAATRGAAEALGLGAECGRIAPGLAADLIVVADDPLAGIAALREPELVVVRGQVLERAGLDELLATLAGRHAETRARLNEPLDIERPPLPETGVLVLEGQVETRALNQRVSAERFAVAREADGRIHLSARTRYPISAGSVPREMTLEETLDASGRLESFRVRLIQGEESIECLGLWTAGSMRLRRLVNGKPIEIPTPETRPYCLDIGSVLTTLTLGQRLPERPFPVLTFHEALEPELSQWEMMIDEEGDHHVRTHIGRMAFRFDERGAPLLWRTQVGRGIVETKLQGEDALGGAGLPFTAEKRRVIAERRAAVEAAAATEAGEPAVPAGADGDSPDLPDTPGDPRPADPENAPTDGPAAKPPAPAPEAPADGAGGSSGDGEERAA